MIYVDNINELEILLNGTNVVYHHGFTESLYVIITSFDERYIDREAVREGIIKPEILTLRDYAEKLNNERSERLRML